MHPGKILGKASGLFVCAGKVSLLGIPQLTLTARTILKLMHSFGIAGRPSDISCLAIPKASGMSGMQYSAPIADRRVSIHTGRV
jgi:hypothetical protein